MSAYYNEHDAFAAAWLRELISAGHIADGVVDERSIEDVTPEDLSPFRQCHFFAGIGVWSLALRQAGWADDRPIWTGSCPCQPFSAAGKGDGFDDERHLWPAFHYLIGQCRPPIVLGEQVAGKSGDSWLDLVSVDMEATGYALGAVETVACGFGAPHKRTRNYWMAHRLGERPQGRVSRREDEGRQDIDGHPRCGGTVDGVAGIETLNVEFTDGGGAGAVARGDSETCKIEIGERGQNDGAAVSNRTSAISSLADPQYDDGRTNEPQRGPEGRAVDGGVCEPSGLAQHERGTGAVNGLWANADWLHCRDRKWRPVESGTFPLVNAGAFRNRVGVLRGAGNAVTLGQAQEFIAAAMKSI